MKYDYWLTKKENEFGVILCFGALVARIRFFDS